jgi:SDR family mycofactocin-dependent oxidoreductase
MGKLEGKVAFITGAARGQGRSHAIRLAEEGADIIALDLCAQLDTVEYPLSTPDDLAETVKLVEDTGRTIIARQADVRDADAVQAVVDEGVGQLGRLDIIIANAGIMPIIGERSQRRQAWHDAIDVMLSGVFNTVEAGLPTLLDGGRGGSIVITSSSAGLYVGGMKKSAKSPGGWGYVAAKHGVVGLMRAYAVAFGPDNIRCNSIHPTGVATPMVMNEAFLKFGEEHPDFADTMQNLLPVPLIEPIDVSNAILYLCSEDGRYVTGVTLPVDAGLIIR